jgi:hypothetical protein
MIVFDSLLVGGVRFVLDKVANAVDAEMNDDASLREMLLDAQMRLELGELSQAEFEAIEGDVMARLREVRDRQRGAAPTGPLTMESEGVHVAGVEAVTTFDEAPRAAAATRKSARTRKRSPRTRRSRK